MKKALKVDAQIEKLKKRGMQFGDEEKAREILLDVGYYRLGFYSFPFERTYPRFEHRDHKFKEGTTKSRDAIIVPSVFSATIWGL